MAIPDPANVAPWYLRNITQALALDETTGNVYLRTGFTGDIIIEGNVNIPGEIDTHINSVGTLGNITTPYLPVGGNVTVFQGTSPWVVTGNANVEITSGNVGITGNVNIGTMPTVNATITSGNVITTVASVNPAYTTAFEEIMAVPFYPEIQIDAVYGFLPDTMYVRQVGNGTAGVNGTSLFYANSSTTTGSTGLIGSSNYMRYRPGQGAMTRLTAAYTMANATAGIQGATQLAGIFHTGEGYFFGFSGDSAPGNTGVGILHSYNGTPEIRTLTINTAPTGAQTATITLNSVPYTVSINAGSAANTAAQIAVGNTYGNSWFVDAVNSTVTFTRSAAGPQAGTYSLASSGTGTLAAGTFAQDNAGVASTNHWTYQADWNGTPVTFDPQYLNVYGIDFRWLGAGIVRFFMEDPTTGAMTLAHTQHWTSTSDQPHCQNPTFKLGWISSAVSSPAVPAVVTGASAMSAIQGEVVQTSFSNSWFALNSGSRAQNVYHHLLTIRNPYHRNGKENTQELVLQELTVALQGTDPSVVMLFVNGTPSVNLLYQSIPYSSSTWSDTTATFDPTVDQPVCVFTVGINGNSQFDLIPFHLNISPGDTVNIVVRSTNSISNSAVGITWQPE